MWRWQALGRSGSEPAEPDSHMQEQPEATHYCLNCWSYKTVSCNQFQPSGSSYGVRRLCIWKEDYSLGQLRISIDLTSSSQSSPEKAARHVSSSSTFLSRFQQLYE